MTADKAASNEEVLTDRQSNGGNYDKLYSIESENMTSHIRNTHRCQPYLAVLLLHWATLHNISPNKYTKYNKNTYYNFTMFSISFVFVNKNKSPQTSAFVCTDIAFLI